MADQNEAGYWINSMGEVVPQKYVNAVDKKRDQTVERLYKKAKKLQSALASFKEEGFDSVEAYLDWLTRHHRVNARTDKGNKTLTNFSGNRRMEVRIAQVIDFDERLQLAKDVIDQCLSRWSEGGNENLIVVVNQAFKVDKKGQLDRNRIIGLLQLEIRDKEWQQAMELIRESMKVVGRRAYLAFMEKDESGKWQSIPLNIAEV